MKFQIGFSAADSCEEESGTIFSDRACAEEPASVCPRKSVVQVYFAQRNMTLAYYNDRFHLRPGDLVYVDGKLEGLRGRVVSVNYNFKIKLSEYKRVIAVADTKLSGAFYFSPSHILCFDPSGMPYEKLSLWFKAPESTEEEYAAGDDGEMFLLDDLSGFHVSERIAERGHAYYVENRVRFLSLDGIQGHAIVEGEQAYELEFQLCDGEVRKLRCSCFCSGHCKHELAVVLQLRDNLEQIRESYPQLFAQSGYFAAVDKASFFSMALMRRDTGLLQL